MSIPMTDLLGVQFAKSDIDDVFDQAGEENGI